MLRQHTCIDIVTWSATYSYYTVYSSHTQSLLLLTLTKGVGFSLQFYFISHQCHLPPPDGAIQFHTYYCYGKKIDHDYPFVKRTIVQNLMRNIAKESWENSLQNWFRHRKTDSGNILCKMHSNLTFIFWFIVQNSNKILFFGD